MTPWAEERYSQSKPTFGPRGVPVLETNDPVYACFPPGTPRIYMHPFPVEIIQTPGRIVSCSNTTISFDRSIPTAVNIAPT